MTTLVEDVERWKEIQWRHRSLAHVPCEELIDRLSAHIAQLEKAGEWQTMESAPKDGTDFLAYLVSGYICRGRYIAGNYFAADSLGPSKSTPDDPTPTHWMPLPAKPGEGAKT